MALVWSISSNADEYKRTICLEWQLQFAEGDTATVLVAQAADADLLIGTRTNQDWTGDVSGPVTHECLGRMTCPIVAVPLDEPYRP